jgi:LmbE family N-acetylglucosaminyl deacetylase
MAPTINPATGPKTYPEQMIRNVHGCTPGIAANGILKTADIVPNMEMRAISFELVAELSNSKKNAVMVRITSTVASKAGLMRTFSGQFGKAGRTKETIPITNMSIRQIRLLFMLVHPVPHRQ